MSNIVDASQSTSLTRRGWGELDDPSSTSPWLMQGWESIICPNIDMDEIVIGCCDLSSANSAIICPGFDGGDAAVCDTQCEVWPSHIICTTRPRASYLSQFSDFVPDDDDDSESCSVEVVMPAKAEARPRRRVSFSQLSEGVFIPEDEAESKWYTPDEEINFILTRMDDARRVARALEQTPGRAPVSQDQILDCVGIEALITEGLARHAEESRLSHLEAVLLEQNMQKQRGISDPDRLSKVSRMRSRWTKERAQKLATGYSKFLRQE